MESIAKHTYPQVVWREGQKKLWNPIHRKSLKNRPEERVRLRIIEYLVRSGWSKHRITTEEAVGQLANTSMRTDIICYSQQFEPIILIECKAEHIPISNQTAEQVARYNQNVKAPYLMMTNGQTDFWYEVGKNKVQQLPAMPEIINDEVEYPAYDYKQWQGRGFAGSKASPELRRWLKELLPHLWQPEPMSRIQFLGFSQQLTDLDLSHYYHVEKVSSQKKVAISTLNTPYGGSRLVAILNENGENRAVLEVNLDLVFDDKKRNSTLYFDGGPQVINSAGIVSFSTSANPASLIEQTQQVFSHHLD